MTDSESGVSYNFPAVRGQQANKPFYITTCPLRLIPKIFIYDEEECPVELRAQRTLNKSRIPEMARYMVEGPKDYVFSAITASVSQAVVFTENVKGSNIGTLSIPMEAQILINDGQHRRAAIEEALKERPELSQDNIAVLFFIDEGLKRSQQIFADLNKYAVRPSPSLSTMYDHRDHASDLARYLAFHCKPFKGYTEFESSTISLKSSKLFTLSSIKQASRILIGKTAKEGFSESEKTTVTAFWTAVFDSIPEWQQLQNKQISAAELRRESIIAHGIGLQSLAMVGKALITFPESEQQTKLTLLRGIDWSKTNPMWANRAMQHGRLSKALTNIFLTSLQIKREIEMNISEQELAREEEYLGK
jgi:DNA sulfur modification protein DndB